MVKARIPFLVSLVFVVASAGVSEAQTSDADRLKAELEALRLEFAGRIAELEARLKAVEASPPPAATPAPTPEAAAPAAPAQASAMPPSSSRMFNPDIAAIGNFIGAAGKSPGGGEPSMEFAEAEVSLQAVVDPYARADVFLTFGPEEVGIEEAFITFPTLPAGFLMKVGQMRDAFGKMNAAHAHVVPFTDRPLLTQNLLGGEEGLSDAGISLSRLFPNKVAFLEATAQVYQGNSEIFQAEKRSDLAYVGHLRAYRDLTESTNLDIGGSFAHGHNDAGPGETTELWGADLTFRYRPLRRSIYTSFLARGEAAWSKRSEVPGPRAFGAYGYLQYQFARRWTAGARFDISDRATDPTVRDKGGSLLLTFKPSEFSLVRGQYRHTRFGEGVTSNEFLFQFLFSIGAHAAHPF